MENHVFGTTFIHGTFTPSFLKIDHWFRF